MFQRIRNRAQDQGGFTLIELLVVILIIGILAAVAIPSFLNQRGKAQDANVKSDIKTAQLAEETYFTDNQTYTQTAGDLTTIEPTLTSATTTPESLAPSAASATGYTLTAVSPSGVTYTLTRAANGTVTRGCTFATTANPAGCKAGTTAGTGTW
jgi:type IV pilus assembly protein PilA